MRPGTKLYEKLHRPGKPRACYCLRMAFQVAETTGDRESALDWWKEAMLAGYNPKFHVKMRLLAAIAESERRNR
jgi:hypothetical protein